MKSCQQASLDEVMDRVTRADILLDFGPFLKLSPEGHDLLQGLLARDPSQRLTAEVRVVVSSAFRIMNQSLASRAGRAAAVVQLQPCHVTTTLWVLEQLPFADCNLASKSAGSAAVELVQDAPGLGGGGAARGARAAASGGAVGRR